MSGKLFPLILPLIKCHQAEMNVCQTERYYLFPEIASFVCCSFYLGWFWMCSDITLKVRFVVNNVYNELTEALPVWIFPERISGEDLTSHQMDKIFTSAGQVYRWHIKWPVADVLLSSGQMRGYAHRFDSHVTNVLQIPPQVSAHLPARSRKPLWHPSQSTSITQCYGSSPVL